MGNESNLKGIVGLLVIVIGVLGFLLYQNQRQEQPTQADSPNRLMTEADLRNKLTELNMQREKIATGMKQLAARKQEAVEQLKLKGIDSSDTFSGSNDPDVKYAF